MTMRRSWEVERERYIEIARSLDSKFGEIEKDSDAFFCFVGGWFWYRHDNLFGHIKYSYEGVNAPPKPTLIRQVFSLFREALKALRVYMVRPKKQNPPTRGAIFYNTFSGDRLGAFYERLKSDGLVADYHLKDSLSCCRRVKGHTVYAHISLISIITSMSKAGVLYYKHGNKFGELSGYVTLSRVFNAVLYSQCLKSALNSNKIEFVVSSVSLNNPYARILFFTCRLLGVTAVNLVQKPFAAQSIPFLAGVRPVSIGIPDHVIVINRWHQSLLRGSLPRDSLVHVGYKDDVAENKGLSTLGSVVQRVLIVLGVDESVNFDMVSLFSEAWSRPADCVLIKTHPLLAISQQPKLSKLIEKEGYVVTSGLWEEIVAPGRTLSISASSTAQAEAASFGAYVLWVPFLDKKACVHHFIIDDLGYACVDIEDFMRVLPLYFLKSKFLDEIWTKQARVLRRYLPEGNAYSVFKRIIDDGR